MTREQLRAAVTERLNAVRAALATLTDEAAVDAMEAFEAWRPGAEYTAGQRVRDGGKLYRVVQGHVSQEGWEPATTPALFAEVAKPGEIPVWRQPTGAQDAYRIGDKVRYPDADGPVYICTADFNVYAPDVYGWELWEDA